MADLNNLLRPFDSFTPSEQMDFCMRRIMIHSHIYYHQLKPFTLVEDRQYDKWMKEMDELIKANPDEIDKCEYANAIREFDPSTWYHLIIHITKEQQERILKCISACYRVYGGCSDNKVIVVKKKKGRK